MKLAHAAFVYPRLELNYVKEWMDYHERMGVDHVYMTLHLNHPLDKPLSVEQIRWMKKPGVPYVMDGTELELVARLKDSIKDHINRGRVTFNTIRRKLDTTGTSHRGDQVSSYKWAANSLRKRHSAEWAWMLVGDIDEFFLPVPPKKTLKDLLINLPPRVGGLRCGCVIHPSRYDHAELQWNTYIPVIGQRYAVSKYMCNVNCTAVPTIHWPTPLPGFTVMLNHSFHVHHFRGFDKYAIVHYGWPTQAYRTYVTKQTGEPFVIHKTLPTK